MSSPEPADGYRTDLLCLEMYVADLRPEHQRYAFVFEVAASRSRFTVYTGDQDRFRPSHRYTLAITERP